MWKAKTKIYDRIILDQERKETVYKLINEFNIPPIGVAIVFDNEDYLDYRNEVWRNQGIHINIKEGGIEEMSPQHLYDIMNSFEYSTASKSIKFSSNSISKPIFLFDNIKSLIDLLNHLMSQYLH